MAVFRLVVLLLVATGCIEDQLVPCGDQLCPAGDSCDVARSICVMPNGLSIEKEVAIEHALCGQTTGYTLRVHNFSTTEIPYDTILTDVGVVATPATGSFAPDGDTDITLSAEIPLDAVPGQPLDGALFIPLTDDSVVRRPLHVTPTGAVLAASAHSLSFGENPVASPAMSQLQFTNSGNIAVDLSATVTGASEFTITSSSQLQLQPGDSRSFALSFQGTVEQSYASQLVVTPNATLCQPPLDPVGMTGDVTQSAILLDHLSYDFGDVGCSSGPAMSTLTLTSTNAMPQAVTLALGGPDAALFSLDTTGLTLPGMGQAIVRVTRKPLQSPPPTGARAAQIDITATLPQLVTHKTVALGMVVKAPIVAATDCVDLSVVPPNSIAHAPFGVGNLGNITAAVALSGVGPNTSVSPSNLQIPANAATMVIFTIDNANNYYLDVSGAQLGLATVANGCAPQSIPVFACGGLARTTH